MTDPYHKTTLSGKSIERLYWRAEQCRERATTGDMFGKPEAYQTELANVEAEIMRRRNESI